MWLAVGGAIGTCARYALTLAGNAVAGAAWWPWGTFFANSLGSFGLGVVFVWLEGRTLLGADLRFVLGTGVMGGFTTYSTFNLEAIRLADAGQWPRALAYMGGTVIVCLLACLVGLWLGKQLRGGA